MLSNFHIFIPAGYHNKRQIDSKFCTPITHRFLEAPLSPFNILTTGTALAEIIDWFIKNIDRQANKKYDLILFI